MRHNSSPALKRKHANEPAARPARGGPAFGRGTFATASEMSVVLPQSCLYSSSQRKSLLQQALRTLGSRCHVRRSVARTETASDAIAARCRERCASAAAVFRIEQISAGLAAEQNAGHQVARVTAFSSVIRTASPVFRVCALRAAANAGASRARSKAIKASCSSTDSVQRRAS